MKIVKPKRKRVANGSSNSFAKQQVQRHSGRNAGRKKKQVSSINPASLIKKASSETQKEYQAPRSFDEMPIDSKLKSALSAKGFSNPTKIQNDTLELLQEGRDLVGIANTGTGKTGAFLIPVIDRLLTSHPDEITLVIVPTRELALQVETEFRSLTKGMKLFSASFIGGTSVGRDVDQLRKRNHLIIGTPGRLLDLASRGSLKLHTISRLILDEFDRMLDMGFVNDIKKVISKMTNREQTMLFSATIDGTQKSLINQILTNPAEIKVSSGTSTSDQIEQDIIKVDHGADKFDMLLHLIGPKEFEKVLIFAETKRTVNQLSKKLNQSGVRSDMIHGNKSQNYRNNALQNFKNGKIKILVATDVAARGIDVSDITHVINYQLPMNFDSYVHRIGRTGRAGKLGKAFTFID